jgi:hypothetical protein
LLGESLYKTIVAENTANFKIRMKKVIPPWLEPPFYVGSMAIASKKT